MGIPVAVEPLPGQGSVLGGSCQCQLPSLCQLSPRASISISHFVHGLVSQASCVGYSV